MKEFTQLLPAGEGRPQGTPKGEGVAAAIAPHEGRWRIVVGEIGVVRR